MSEQERMTLIERLYSGVNGELFFDSLREMNYHVEEVYGDVLNLGSTTLIVKYQDGKSRFLYLHDHMNDQEVVPV